MTTARAGDGPAPVVPRTALPRPRASARRSGRSGRPVLADAFDPRRNALDALRLLLAGTVAVVHALQTGFGSQPVLGSATLGDLAVDGFFVVSGFLVARSWTRLGSLPRFAWHRFLRIAPGFWACLLVTAALVAPLGAVLAGRPAAAVLDGPHSAPGYVAANALLLVRQFGVSAVPDPLGGGEAVLDGSLWTLFWEACCYAGLALLGLLGVLGRRRRLLLPACAGLWAATAVSAAGVDLGTSLMLRFAFVFLLGAAGWVFADRVPVSGLLAAACVPLLAAGLVLLPDHRALAGPAFAYLVLWAVVRLPLRWRARWDLSYGLYVYHWPVQLLLALAGAAALGRTAFVVLSLLPALAAAALSWVLVERPALRLKDARPPAR